MKTFYCFALLLLCVLALCFSVFAADGQTMTQEEYCYHAEDFAEENSPELQGIFVIQVPEQSVACIVLGSRIIRAGDMLPAQRLKELRLLPCCTENSDAALGYLPVFRDGLGENSVFTVRIQSGKNEPPKAIRQDFETYKNIANDGKLSGQDPENAALTFRLEEPPKLGSIQLESDGSYVYTPHKNKVGEDSFTFTVTDEAGNESTPATVNIRILKPTEAMTFGDLEGSLDQFEAMWLWDEGLCGGREVAGTVCFYPDEPVSRSEFLIMAMELQNTPVDTKLTTSGFTDATTAPAWVQPYLASAMQHGFISGEVRQEGLMFRPNDPITGQETAVMLQNILKLPVKTGAFRKASHWADEAIEAMNEAGLQFDTSETMLTRMDVAKLLWQVSSLLPQR